MNHFFGIYLLQMLSCHHKVWNKTVIFPVSFQSTNLKEKSKLNLFGSIQTSFSRKEIRIKATNINFTKYRGKMDN